jgi:phage gpG-like protein
VIEARIDSAPARAALAQWRHAFAARLAGVFADGAAALLESARAKLSGSVLASGSGRLRASLRAEVTSKAGGFAARVWSDGSVPYARIQEYGGRIAVPEIRAIETKALAFAYGGRLVFTRMTRAHAVDIPERSFLRSALAEFAPAFAEAIAKVADGA